MNLVKQSFQITCNLKTYMKEQKTFLGQATKQHNAKFINFLASRLEKGAGLCTLLPKTKVCGREQLSG